MSRKTYQIAFLLFALLLPAVCSTVSAEIGPYGIKSKVVVSCRDTSAATCEIIDIPIYISDVTNLDIQSVGLALITDPDCIEPIGAVTKGTLTEKWGAPTFHITDVAAGKRIEIAIAGAEPLIGSGVLIFVRYVVNPFAPDASTCPIHIEFVLLNEKKDGVVIEECHFTVDEGDNITGNIRYYSNNLPIENVLVTLFGTNLHSENIFLTTSTDANGNYEFLGVQLGLYTIRPSKMGDIRNVVISPLDAALVLKYLAGVIKLSPLQLIAAEVTGNGSISPLDASEILRHFVGSLITFTIGKEWKFVPADFVESELDEINWSIAPDSVTFVHVDDVKIDFLGIALGDVSGNWPDDPLGKPSLAPMSKSSNANFALPISATNIAVSDSILEFSISQQSTAEISAIGFDIQYNPDDFEFTRIASSELMSNLLMAKYLVNGTIHVAFAGADPVRVNGEVAKVQLRVQRPLQTNSKLSISHIIINETKFLDSIPIALQPLQAHTLPTSFDLRQNYPNPFNPRTIIEYHLPEETHAVLEIFNLLGNAMTTLVDKNQKSGIYHIDWEATDHLGRRLPSGVYFYRLKAGSYVATRKMLLLPE